MLYAAPPEWASLRRGTDFYDEGWLIWLGVDTQIRQLTNGERAIDDFCQRFHGGASGSPAVSPYTLDDVVATLNQVAPFDWKSFLAGAGGSHRRRGAARRHRPGRLAAWPIPTFGTTM